VKYQRRPVVILAILALFLTASPAIAQQSQTEIEDITDAVAQVRQLPVKHEVPVTIMTRQELGDELRATTEEDYPEAEQYADEREMLAFGLMDEHIDFGDLSEELYTEQIAGYYDPQTGKMVVVQDSDQSDGFTPTQQVTYAHEIVHALQDQNFDLDAGPLNRQDASDDQSLAVTALIEGDASFSEVQYLIGKPELLQAYLDEIDSIEFNSDVLDSVPPLIRETLLFPYDQGYTFVEALQAEGGWDAVDAAFTDPPQSTEQVLHPEKYLEREQPILVHVNDFSGALGDDWTVWDTNTFGEFQIRVILQQTSLSDQQAEVAAAGWGGDTYVVAGTDTQDAIHWVSTWDTEQDAQQFAKAWALREAERWGVDPTFVSENVIEFHADGAVARITLDGSTVDYLMAPDQATMDAIIAAPPATPTASPVASPAA
jgi:hypothetical protein